MGWLPERRSPKKWIKLVVYVWLGLSDFNVLSLVMNYMVTFMVVLGQTLLLYNSYNRIDVVKTTAYNCM